MALGRYLADLAGTRWTSFFAKELRTRVGNTGGGDVFSRSFRAGPAGFYYITDPSGNVVGFAGPDGSPAVYFTFGGGTGPLGGELDPLSINLSTGQVIIPNLKHASNILLSGGAKGGAVLVPGGGEASSLVSGSWTITGWTLITDVLSVSAGTRVEVRKQTYAAYDNATWTSMSGTTNATGGLPRTGLNAMKNTSTNLSSWPSTTLNEGDVISSVISNNGAGSAWYSLMLHGIKVEK